MKRRRLRLALAVGGPLLLGFALLAGGRMPAPTPTGHDAMSSMHEVQVPAAAYVPLASPISRAAWTVTASDTETSAENTPAGNAIDGNDSTFWHSHWSGGGAPLPHSITIDTHASSVVSALTYQGPTAGDPDGRIGRFSVSLSNDGSSWGSPVSTGTWADDTTVKTAAFTQQATRYVRLTALSEAGNRGPWTSVAELNLLGASSVAPKTQYVAVARTGWTAQAGDQETTAGNYAAGLAVDGNIATWWRSAFTGASAALPHSITVDMKQAIPVAGLTYLPPGGRNGTIGGFRISVSTDGTSFTEVASGTWADGQSQKITTFPTTTARYVRLTGLTEAGNRGPWSGAAEITMLQRTSSAPTLGSWGPVINFPIVPVSAALLPGNKLLTFSAVGATNYTANQSLTAPNADSRTQTSILDLSTGAVSQRVISNTRQQMFCSGLALLPDGRVLVNGGSDSGATSIYSPSTDTWTAGPRMTIPRGYEGDTTLSTGQVFTLGGSWNGGRGGKDGEVFTPDGSWRRLPNVTAAAMLTNDAGGIYRADNHGWFFAVSNGGVFHAGPSRQMNWFTTSGDGSQTGAGPRGSSDDAMNGNAVMYDVGKILTVGGAPSYENADATAKAFAVDIGKGPGRPVTTTQVGSMAVPRAFSSSVVLPDGTVLVVGGQPRPVVFTDTNASLVPELWNPATGAFTQMAPMAVPRDYHSVALLLPDGRVFAGGGGLCGPCATNHSDGQIYTPPYLLNADGTARARPTLSGTPATANRGSTIAVTAPSGVSNFALVRMGAVTHTVDSDQRRIPVRAAYSFGTRHYLAIPSDSGVAVPGYYLLFAINSAGTPSVAQTVRII